MALDFTLEIDSCMTPAETLELLLQIDGFCPTTDALGFYADGIVCSIHEITGAGHYGKFHREMMQEKFGFVPNLKFSYRPDSYDDYEKGMRNGLKAFMTVLQHDNGDAVCILNGESIKFTRINGKLILNSDSFSTDKQAVCSYDQVPFPFETQTFELID